MAGAGYKLFNTGDVLTAAQVNTYLQEQTVMVFANATARTTALSGVLAEGMMSYLQDTNAVEVYDGSAWVSIGSSGDITGVTAGTGISGGGTSGTVTITNDMATTITASGDIIVGTGSGTYDNLPIGTTGQVLTADTTVSPYKVKWASAAAASFVGCSIYNSTDFATNNNASVIMTFNSETFDTDSLHSTSSNTSRITIPSGKGGKWLFVMNIGWSHIVGTSNAGIRQVTLKKNGSDATFCTREQITGMGGTTAFVTFSSIVEAVATDYFELELYQNSGSNSTAVRGGSFYNNWSCQYLGA